jgi:hypothetical protein
MCRERNSSRWAHSIAETGGSCMRMIKPVIRKASTVMAPTTRCDLRNVDVNPPSPARATAPHRVTYRR